MSHLWQDAAAFAARAHRNQIRRDERTPYISHPVRVALTVALKFGCMDETVIAAALLHDVLEDTTADYDDLLSRFGKEVADLVADLSKDGRKIEAVRERAYDEQLRRAPPAARLIKLADVYDNLADATDEASRRKLVERAERAIRLAGSDPDLQPAAEALQALVDRTLSQMAPR